MHTPIAFRLIATVIASLSILTDSNAAVVVSADQSTFVSSAIVSQYSLDVFVDLTGPDDGGSLELGNLQVRAELTGPNAGTDIAIIGVGETMSLSHPQGRLLDGTSVVSSTEAFGFTVNFGNAFTIGDQDGLMRFTLEVQPNVTGDYTLEILPGDGNTILTDGADFTTPLAYSVSNGRLSISSIPEPAFSTILLILSCALLTRRRRNPRISCGTRGSDLSPKSKLGDAHRKRDSRKASVSPCKIQCG